jgi:integrase
MFTTWFSGEQRRYYGESLHRARIDHVGQCLREQRYLDVVVRDHVHEWLRFTRYLEARGLPLPASVHAAAVHDYVAGRLPGRSASRGRFIWASIRLFLEMDEAGQVPRRVRVAPPPLPCLFPAWVPPYLTCLRHHRGLAVRTLRQRAFPLRQCLACLAAAGATDLQALTAASLQDFCTHLPGRSPATRRSYGGTLRGFLRWAYLLGHLPQDLSRAARIARQFRHARLPDTLPAGELERLLQAVDRSTPIGRRDYAVLRLAARYGLRPSDIRARCLEQIDWRRGRFTLPQVKTGHALTLPLLPDVAAALAAYLRHGRPATAARHLFVRHTAPCVPCVPENNLAPIMRTALRRVGLAQRPGRRGLYRLRHTLATRLLAAGQPLKTIADILGHRALDSTFGYPQVDLRALGTVALAEAEVLRCAPPVRRG